MAMAEIRTDGVPNWKEEQAFEGDTQEVSDSDMLTLSAHDRQGFDVHDGAWARLVSIKKMYPNIEVKTDEVSLGRSEAMGDKRVSKMHCRIWRHQESGVVHIRDHSINGTIVRGITLKKDEVMTLEQGDDVALGPPGSGLPAYFLQLLGDAQHQPRKRQSSAMEVSNGGFVAEAGVNGDCPDTKKPKVIDSMETEETLKCGICLNIWHDVVSMAPCLHNFCNACFSDWYRIQMVTGVCKCPHCRVPVVSVARNPTLRVLVEGVLREKPDLRRSAEEIAKLDAASLIKSDFMKLAESMPLHATQQPISATDSDTSSEVGLPCRQCELSPDGETAAVSGRFRCGPETNHLQCNSCFSNFPARNDIDIPQLCRGCGHPYCATYWQSQNLPSARPVAPSCTAVLKPMSERDVQTIPGRTFWGNSLEQHITRLYIMEQRFTLQDILRDWLNKLDSGEAGPVPIPNADQSSDTSSPLITSTTPLCDNCAENVVAHLLYKFRLSVPKSELPPEAAGREDCWYGYLCRTQHHRELHARKFNHACEPKMGRTLTIA